MPFYDYICEQCEDEFEKTQGINEKPLEKCNKCPGQLRRKIHASPIHFKGKGFYITDYKKK